MTRLCTDKKKSALGEALYAFTYPLRHQKSLLATQFWPTLVLIAALLVLGFGAYLMPRSAFTGQVYHAPPFIQDLEKTPIEVEREVNGGPTIDVQSHVQSKLMPISTIPGLTGTQTRFDFSISLMLFLISTLMSQVRMMRYMVLGEGQDHPRIPKCQFGLQELKLFGWSIIVKFVVPALILVPFYFLIQPAIDHQITSEVLQILFWIVAVLAVLRFVMAFPAAACGHKTGLTQAWRQLEGNFVSYLFANVWMLIFSTIYLAVFFALPGFLLFNFGGDLIQNVYTGGALVLVSILYYVWAYYMYMASQMALLCRYYHFGLRI